MKRILLLWLALVAGLAEAQVKVAQPVFVPRKAASKVMPPRQEGENVFIDATDAKLKGKNQSGQVRELGGSGGSGSGFRYSALSSEPTTATSGPGQGQTGDFYYKSSTNEFFLRINELGTDSKVLKFSGVSILGYTGGQVSTKWASPSIQAINTTSNSVTLTFTNPNAGAFVRADYSLASAWGSGGADVNDNSGTKWKYGTNIAGPSTAGATQSLTISGLSPSTLYYYRFIVYGEGKTDSDWAYAGGQSTGSAGEALTVPVLSASVSGYDATITWTDQSVGHTNYRLQRKLSLDEGFVTVSATIGPNARQYIDYGLAGGATYQYQLRAEGPTTTGNYSAPVSVTTGTSVVPVPGITATLVSGTNVRIDFTGNHLAWEIQRRTGGTGSFVTITTINGNDIGGAGQTYIDGPISENVLYEYRIRGKAYPDRWSAYSTPVAIQRTSGTTGGGGGPSGPDLGATGNNGTSARVTSYFPTMAQIYNQSYDLDANFTRKDLGPTVSPFWNPNWQQELGATPGKPLVTQFGYGAYYVSNASWGEVDYNHKIHELSQTSTFNLFGKDHDMLSSQAGPQGAGVVYQTDWGSVELVVDASNYFHNWASLDYLSVDYHTIGSAGHEGAITRYDVEHAEFSNTPLWIGHRNTWRTVDYRKAVNGGTNPLYMNMSDADFMNMFLDHVTRIYVTLYKKTIATVQGKGGTPVVLFYGSVNPSSPIWNRRVKIDGVDQPTIAEMAGAANMNDKVVGHYAFQLAYPGQNWKYPYLDRARKEVTLKENMVTGKPSRYRIIQTNASNSLRPTLRLRMEDEDGNLCYDQDHIAYAILIKPWRSSASPATDQVVVLRSENDQTPDQTVTLNEDVNLAWWNVYSNPDMVVDKAIASFFKTTVADRAANGSVRLFQQVYPYMVHNCSVMYGPGAQGQCEATVASSLPVDLFNALWVVRSPRNFVTGLWQWDGAVTAQELTGPEALRKGNIGYNSRVNSLKSLQTFNRYKAFYATGVSTVPFEVSYDGGTTWKNSTQYYAELDNESSTKAAVEVVYNSSLNKALIAGRPLYADAASVQVRYTIPGQAQVTETLPLNKALEDGWYFSWKTTTL